MTTQSASAQATCESFLQAQLAFTGNEVLKNRLDAGHPAVTLSRQVGARGRIVGSKLRLRLEEILPGRAAPWQLFDRDLVNHVIEDHHLPQRLSAYMPETRTGEIEGIMGEILGLHPSTWTLSQRTSETILKLARFGDAIIVGRGGNFITQGLDNVVHVRLIGSEENRLKRVTEVYNIPAKEAARFILKEEKARRSYIRQHFARSLDEPLAYDITVNTDRVSDTAIVDLIAELVISRVAHRATRGHSKS